MSLHWSILVTSRGKECIFSFSLLNSKSKFSRLAEAATIQPSFANFKAKALPIPELAPVIQRPFLSSRN